ncbi:hypothetical protein [Streptomyces sp. NPDC059176]|uniref:hypothetical protein n=1 Tax=Streptomyces sp. NPDC059176 TaxID=3346758 RepID=UPI0036BB9405
MHPNNTPQVPGPRAVDVHQPTPIPAPTAAPAPLVQVQPGPVPAVASIVLPDGRIVTGYTLHPTQPEPTPTAPVVSRTAVNIALGGVGFLAVCGGLLMLTTFIAALAALVQQLIILAAVIFGGWIATHILSPQHSDRGTTVHIRKAIFKRNHFHS